MQHRTPVLVLITALLCLVGCSPSGPTPAPEGLVITNPTAERPYFHEFGNLPYGALPRHTFRVANREGRPVTIQDIQSVCWCTQPSAVVVAADGTRSAPSRDGKGLVLPVDGQLELTVTIDTKLVEKMNIDKLALVRLRSDSTLTPYISFELHLVVKRPFRSVPAELDLGRIGHSSGKSGRVDCSVEVKGDPSRLIKIERVEGPFEASMQETTIAGETVWIVSATAPAGLPRGPIRGKVVLAATAPQGHDQPAPWEVPVVGTVVDDVVALPPVLNFGLTAQGSATTIVTDLVSSAQGASFRVLRHSVEGLPSADITVQWTPQSPDADGRADRWRAQVQATARDTGTRGLATGVLVVETDHPLQQLVRIELSVASP
jgi:hypothetical protein